MLKVLLISLVLLGLGIAGMAIKMLFDRNAKFSGSSCASTPEMEEKGISCGCGGTCNTNETPTA
jgi:hypothetical protein